MWELELVDGLGNSARYYCKSQRAALERAREYLDRAGGVAEIHIRPATREVPDDRRAA